MMRFKNKIVAITGAATGIGRATAVRFASEGADVVALDVNCELLSTLEHELAPFGGRVVTLVCDVSDENAVNQAFETAKKKLGNINILINNAALWRHFGSFEETTTDVWKKYFDVNVMGVVHCTKAVLPDMIEAGWGRIINVASVAGVYGNPNMVHYSATKGAVISMTMALAKEVCDKGVLVNSVSPGTVTNAELHDYDATESNPLSYLGRTGSDNENANLICFIASSESSYISGQNIQIDGCRRII